ncbi:MAG: peptidoglycan DD-metalloendopeptidase family protein [Lachnospiraceae bacterium]
MNKGKKIISFMLIGILSLGFAVPTKATSIDEATKKANDLEAQKKAAENEQASLATQLNGIIDEMKKAQEEMAAKEAEIQTAEDELVQAKVEENSQYESMKKRIQYMYENGSSEFIEILLASKDITDFLNKAEYVSEISTYDRDMLVQFQEIVKSVEKKEASLKAEYTQLEVLQSNLTAKQTEMQELLSSKNAQIADLQSEIGANAAVLQTLIEQAQAAEKAQKEAAAAAQAAKESSSGSNTIYTPPGPSIPSGGGSGMFINPCPGSHVSSEFGEYRSPSDPAHKGMDFGTSGAYIPTYAAASGTVIIAGWSNSAGNWVVIDHGNGFVTKYMHHSSLSVSPGQNVSQGQQLGITGNTGASQGVHLHFQVEVNGRAVNPRNYM